MEKKSVRLALRRLLTDPNAPPVSAHKFNYSRLGAGLALEVGFFDPVELQAKVDAATEDAGPIEISYRVHAIYALSPEACADLIAVAEFMKKDLQKEGLLPKEG